MYLLNQAIEFPPTNLADADGLLAIGGDLSIPRLQLAYSKGIFPWYSDDEPILWYAPPERFVLFPNELKISKSMQQVINKNQFNFTYNQQFEAVIAGCKNIDREAQDGTWITNEMEQAYISLHKNGISISAETWYQNELVGGLYGVLLKKVFCGESMFSIKANASKFAFIQLVKMLQNKGIALIDCQVYTTHLESLGARLISRQDFEKYL
jgi:leucyl/phenylalanyl-tRNA---protein transferase